MKALKKIIYRYSHSARYETRIKNDAMNQFAKVHPQTTTPPPMNLQFFSNFELSSVVPSRTLSSLFNFGVLWYVWCFVRKSRKFPQNHDHLPANRRPIGAPPLRAGVPPNICRMRIVMVAGMLGVWCKEWVSGCLHSVRSCEMACGFVLLCFVDSGDINKQERPPNSHARELPPEPRIQMQSHSL